MSMYVYIYVVIIHDDTCALSIKYISIAPSQKPSGLGPLSSELLMPPRDLAKAFVQESRGTDFGGTYWSFILWD